MFKIRVMRKIFLFVATLILSVSSAFAEYAVTEFPVHVDFDTNEYAGYLVRLSQGATHTWLPNGGWRGGAAKFTPPTIKEGYGGIGGFTQIAQNLGEVKRINMRFLAYHGSSLAKLGPKNSKLVIMNPQTGTRPMILKNNRYFSDGEPFGFYGACMSTVCTSHDGWPVPGTGFQYGDLNHPENYSEQWVSIELEADIDAQTISMYIHTLDGSISGLHAQRTDFNDANYFDRVEGVPGYWGNVGDGWPRVYDENAYILIDEIVIDDQYIGPPQGFVGSAVAPPSTVAPPSPPGSIQ